MKPLFVTEKDTTVYVLQNIVRTKKAIKEDSKKSCPKAKDFISVDEAPRTMSLILKDDLGLAAYKRHSGQFLTYNLKKIMVAKSKQLLKWYEK